MKESKQELAKSYQNSLLKSNSLAQTVEVVIGPRVEEGSNIDWNAIYKLQEELIDGVVQMDSMQISAGNPPPIFPADLRLLCLKSERNLTEQVLFNFFWMRQQFINLKVARQLAANQSTDEE